MEFLHPQGGSSVSVGYVEPADKDRDDRRYLPMTPTVTAPHNAWTPGLSWSIESLESRRERCLAVLYPVREVVHGGPLDVSRACAPNGPLAGVWSTGPSEIVVSYLGLHNS